MSSVSMILRACQEGAGLALLPCIAADGAGLRRAEPSRCCELWLLSHRDAGLVARFTAVTEWLQGHFEAEALALRGRYGS